MRAPQVRRRHRPHPRPRPPLTVRRHVSTFFQGNRFLLRDLVAQLEGTENRITVARNRYIKAVQDYNVTVRSFPTNLTAIAFGYKEKPNFTVENEKAISTAPKVDFNPAPAAPAK